MHFRKVKKYIAGKWNPLKWHQIKKGDLIRLYDRGMRTSDGDLDEFVATSDAYENENGVWAFEYAPERTIGCESSHDIHQG